MAALTAIRFELRLQLISMLLPLDKPLKELMAGRLHTTCCGLKDFCRLFDKESSECYCERSTFEISVPIKGET